MFTILLLTTLLLPSDLPGTGFARVEAPVVLHAGPSENHAGALTAEDGTLLRAEKGNGAFSTVYVAEGFPIYLHGDYVQVDTARQVAQVSGRRVNARLLPATEGLLPVGQVGAGAGELVLLDVEGAWVRVLAPVGLGLHAPSDALVHTGDAAQSEWRTRLGARERWRQQREAAWRATDPSWRRIEELAATLDGMETTPIASLDATGLARQRETLARLRDQAGDRADLLVRIDGLEQRIQAVEASRSAAEGARAELAAREAQDAANLAREARVLDYGLRFEGKGDPLELEGTVVRRTAEDEDVAVYSLRDVDGRVYKLSAAEHIVDLSGLLGRKVVLEGRSLPLVNVEGKVLIVDRVAQILP